MASLDRSFLAFGPAFRGGVRVAKGDVNGDGVDDIIAAPGPGLAPHVRVFDGVTGAEFRSFFAFGRGFTKGVFVAAADVDGDGKADIIAGQGKLGSKVRIFSGDTGAELFHFFAFDAAFAGGVRVAAGDVNGDGKADVIVGGGMARRKKVRVLDATGNHDELFSFLPFGPTLAAAYSSRPATWTATTSPM